MKLLMLILSLAVANGAVVRNDCQLQQDLRDILDLIDTDAIAGVLVKHLEDPELQAVFVFIFSQEFRDLYLQVAAVPEVVEFLQFVEAQCVDVQSYLNAIRDYLELPPVAWRHASRSTAQRGITDFWDDIKDVIPLDDIRPMVVDKYNSSPAFADFVDEIRSEQTSNLFYRLRENETYQYALAQLQAFGIDTEYVAQVVGSILGWV